MDELERTGVSGDKDLPSYRSGMMSLVPENRELYVLFVYNGARERIRADNPIDLRELINKGIVTPADNLIYTPFNEHLQEYGSGVLACGRTTEQTDNVGLSLNWFSEIWKEENPGSKSPPISGIRPEKKTCQGFFYVKEVEGRRTLYWHDPTSMNGSCVRYPLLNTASPLINGLYAKLQKKDTELNLKGKLVKPKDVMIVAANYFKRELLLNPRISSEPKYSIEAVINAAEHILKKNAKEIQIQSEDTLRFFAFMANYLKIGSHIEDLRDERSIDMLEAESTGRPVIEDSDFEAYTDYLIAMYATRDRLPIHTIFDPSLIFDDLKYEHPKGAPRFRHIRLMDLDEDKQKFVSVDFGDFKPGTQAKKYTCQMFIMNWNPD